MIEQEQIGNGIAYDPQLIEDKHFFGGFFNLAVDNLTALVLAFNAKFKVVTGIDSTGENYAHTILNNAFDPKISYADWADRKEFMQNYLPLLKYIPYNDNAHGKIGLSTERQHFREILIALLKDLNSLRNFYTHHYHSPIEISSLVTDFLDQCFLNVCRDVKQSKLKNDNTRQLLSVKLKEQLEILVAIRTEELKEKERKGEKVHIIPDQIRNYVFNSAFSHLICKRRDPNDNNIVEYFIRNHYKSKLENFDSFENKIPLSASGLLFLLSMFLKKNEGKALFGRVKYFKETNASISPDEINFRQNGLRTMATHWVFSQLAYRGVKQQISTSFTHETLLMQMVDELSKVPNEVYRNVNKETQNLFLEDMNEYVRDREFSETLEDATIIHPVIRKRYENKFNYFALRFLDEYAAFPTLRFQIHLGNYVHDRRTKIIEGTEMTTDRVIKQKVNVFAKLSDTSKVKYDYFSGSGEITQNAWEEFPNPSYNLVGNNIPIYLDLLNSTIDGAKKMEIKIRQIKAKLAVEQRVEKSNLNKVAKSVTIELIDKSKNKLISTMPTALLSMNEIPALLYAFLVEKKTGEELENILIQKLVEHHKTLRDYDPTSDAKLPNDQVPTHLNLSTNKIQINTPKIINAIKDEIVKTKTKLTELSNRKADQKKAHLFSFRENGKEAAWLANDIKRFMPIEIRKNWKARHHRELQLTLAYYDTRHGESKRLLKQFWLPDLWNEIANKIFYCFNSPNFALFLESYLKRRVEILQGWLSTTEIISSKQSLVKKQLDSMNMFFYERLFIIRDTQTQIKHLLAKPFVFPRGIFDSKPTFISGKKPEDSPNDYACWFTWANLSEHNFQQFYSIEKDYKDHFEAKLSDLSNSPEINPKDNQFGKFKMKQDLKIKKVKTQDLFTNKMVEYIYNDLFQSDSTFQLSDYYQTKEERADNYLKAKEQSKKQKGDHSEIIYNTNFFWNLTKPFIRPQINESAVKLSDVGKFKWFLKSHKVSTLLSYDPNRIWTKKELETELSLLNTSYEVVRREQVFKEIHEFEKYILSQHSSSDGIHPIIFDRPGKNGKKGNPSFKHYVVNGVLSRIPDLEPALFDVWLSQDLDAFDLVSIKSLNHLAQKAFILIQIRNKFSHNQLPSAELFHYINEFYEDSAPSVSVYLLEVVVNIIAELKNRIE